MTTVELYRLPYTGSALAEPQDRSLESEIREHELIQKRTLAQECELTQVATRLDLELSRLRCQRSVPYPLMSAEEERVWRAFLPMAYTSPDKSKLDPYNQRLRRLDAYQFDEPPLSVLEIFATEHHRGLFSLFEIWTPEVIQPEPILVGYTDFDKKSIGPFLLARWGEALKPFDAIRTTVEERRRILTTATQILQQAFQPNQLIQWQQNTMPTNTTPTWFPGMGTATNILR